MVNFIIVDDNKSQRKIISKTVLKNMMSNKIEFNIFEFEDYNQELKEFIRNKKDYKIYILDLELANSDGIDIARDIRYKYEDWNSPIIIITVHTSLYYEVYKQRLQILDFVGKCENVDRILSENINICLKMLNKDKTYRYTYKNVEYTINLNNIDYIQRDGRGVKIVTTNKNYFQNTSISELKKILPSYFIISSKGILINLKNVIKIDWALLKVFFKDKNEGYLVSKSHRKEIEEYECA